jgi:hypothetical protein
MNMALTNVPGPALQAAMAAMPTSELVALADLEPRALWRPGTSNSKTGNVASLYIGRTKDESLATCEGCPLLANKRCYSQFGTPHMGAASMRKRHDRLGREDGGYSFANLARSLTPDTWLRDAQLGDSGRLDRVAIRAAHTVARRLGRGVIAYTHAWREVAARGDADLWCASTGSLDEADEALAAGFSRATTVLPWDAYKNGRTFKTPNGTPGIICPNLYNEHVKGEKLTCSDCGMCDPKRKGAAVIGFPDHGAQGRGKARTAARKQGDSAPRWLRSLAGKLGKSTAPKATPGPSKVKATAETALDTLRALLG